MSTCIGITKNNSRCLKPVKAGNLFCHMHTPVPENENVLLPLPDNENVLLPLPPHQRDDESAYNDQADEMVPHYENPMAAEVISLREHLTFLQKELECLKIEKANQQAISKATAHSAHSAHLAHYDHGGKSAQSALPAMSNTTTATTTTTTTRSYSRRQSDVDCRATCKAHGRPCRSSAVKGEEYCGSHINSGWSRDTHQQMTQIVQFLNRMR
eukprot:gene29490-5836_t